MSKATDKIRVDKWLWFARFFKSRSLAGELAGSGALRVNGERIAKGSHSVRPGDVLTFPKAGHIRVIQIDALGERRGPAIEAQMLYTDLEPPQPTAKQERPAAILRDNGAGRPTKKERREIDALRRRGP